MYIHRDTVEALENNIVKFSDELKESIKNLLHLVREYTPLSDINYVLYNSGMKLNGIKTQNGEGSWIPIRNLARIVAKVGDQVTNGTISSISIENMTCGCDYFKGKIKLEINDNKNITGQYKWQWTAFPGMERSFDKFIEFPKLQSESLIAE